MIVKSLKNILYLIKAGCQRRTLSVDFPHWKLVYGYFCKWNRDGTLEETHDMLRKNEIERNLQALGLLVLRALKRRGSAERVVVLMVAIK